MCKKIIVEQILLFIGIQGTRTIESLGILTNPLGGHCIKHEMKIKMLFLYMYAHLPHFWPKIIGQEPCKVIKFCWPFRFVLYQKIALPLIERTATPAHGKTVSPPCSTSLSCKIRLCIYYNQRHSVFVS